MRVIDDALVPGAVPRGAVATIGNYDGIHRGQREVLGRVAARAAASGTAAMVVTFDPHPLRVIDPARAPRRLTTNAQRERLLAELGIDVLVVLPFTSALAATPADRFVREIVVGALGIRELHVGSRFAFGRGREGSLEVLEHLGRELGLAVFGWPEVEIGGAAVSATRIRAAIAAGDVETALDLLGRPYAVAGTVVRGDRRGTRLGFPTLNLAADNEILPASGVYVTEASFAAGGPPHPGVANVGIRPTIGRDTAQVVETHLLDFERSCYDERVELRFLGRLREERRFPSLEELRAQIAVDVERAREYFRAAGR